MWFRFDQVILIRDRRKVRPDDSIVYLKETANGRILIPDFSLSAVERHNMQKELQQYGVLYEDANGRWCVVPDVWNEDDALIAKDWR